MVAVAGWNSPDTAVTELWSPVLALSHHPTMSFSSSVTGRRWCRRCSAAPMAWLAERDCRRADGDVEDDMPAPENGSRLSAAVAPVVPGRAPSTAAAAAVVLSRFARGRQGWWSLRPLPDLGVCLLGTVSRMFAVTAVTDGGLAGTLSVSRLRLLAAEDVFLGVRPNGVVAAVAP